MIPPTLIAEHRLALEAVETLANRDLIDLWRAVDLTDARVATSTLMPEVRELVDVYGDITAIQAADFYDEARAASGPSGRHRATPAPTAPADQVDAMVRWSVTPIWADDPRTGAALARLAGGAQRLIRKADRDTIFESGRRDPSVRRFARVPKRNACDFCLMLASRGDVYHSRTSARSVVGREVREPGRVLHDDSGEPIGWQTGRITGRTGTTRRAARFADRPLGERFHDNCRCATTAIWSDDDLPEINRQLEQEWQSLPFEQRSIEGWREHLAGR